MTVEHIGSVFYLHAVCRWGFITSPNTATSRLFLLFKPPNTTFVFDHVGCSHVVAVTQPRTRERERENEVATTDSAAESRDSAGSAPPAIRAHDIGLCLPRERHVKWTSSPVLWPNQIILIKYTNMFIYFLLLPSFITCLQSCCLSNHPTGYLRSTPNYCLFETNASWHLNY